jgi:hypothetical protein
MKRSFGRGRFSTAVFVRARHHRNDWMSINRCSVGSRQNAIHAEHFALGGVPQGFCRSSHSTLLMPKLA